MVHLLIRSSHFLMELRILYLRDQLFYKLGSFNRQLLSLLDHMGHLELRLAYERNYQLELNIF